MRACLLVLVCWLGLAHQGLAGAAPGLAYSVDLRVPAAQRPLLEHHLDLYRWRGNARMDVDQLRRLVERAPAQIRELLATEGLYSPQVRATLEQNGAAWTVHLAIQPGEPVRVSRIDLSVSGPFDDASAASRERLARLRAQWSLPAGAVFRHADWENAKRAALRELLLHGYPAATIAASQATVDPLAKAAALSLGLDSGPAFSLGPLRISGLQRYPASVIERLNPIRPGEPYDQAKLLELQSRLQDSPYFAGASVHVATDPAHPEQVPVEVGVTENKARSLGLGVGASTDTGPRAEVDYRDLNLLGQAWRLSGTLKLADKEQSLEGELQLPLTRLGYRDSLNASLTRTDVAGEVTRTLVLGAKRNRLLGKNETAWGLRYYRERQDVAGATGDSLSALVPSWSWTRREVDSLLFPSRGYLLNLQADAAAHALLSDRSFLRADGRFSWFHPLGAHGQAILRGELGAVAAGGRDGIPADFLFRTGGDQTVRGYAYQSLGVSEGDAIVGGRSLAVASAEYVHWLSPKWGAAVFIDAGDAADRFADLSMHVGYGLGARWKSPIGPLNLDLAYGRETQALRLHFAVGFSF
jgi:translocation and assembly module TamA